MGSSIMSFKFIIAMNTAYVSWTNPIFATLGMLNIQAAEGTSSSDEDAYPEWVDATNLPMNQTILPATITNALVTHAGEGRHLTPWSSALCTNETYGLRGSQGKCTDGYLTRGPTTAYEPFLPSYAWIINPAKRLQSCITPTSLGKVIIAQYSECPPTRFDEPVHNVSLNHTSPPAKSLVELAIKACGPGQNVYLNHTFPDNFSVAVAITNIPNAILNKTKADVLDFMKRLGCESPVPNSMTDEIPFALILGSVAALPLLAYGALFAKNKFFPPANIIKTHTILQQTATREATLIIEPTNPLEERLTGYPKPIDLRFLLSIINPRDIVWPLSLKRAIYLAGLISASGLTVYYWDSLLPFLEKLTNVQSIPLLVFMYAYEPIMSAYEMFGIPSYPISLPALASSHSVEDSHRLNRDLAVIIPCHNSEKFIAQTIYAALQHVPAKQIFLMDNGPSAHPSDCTKTVAHTISHEINYFWLPNIANKTWAQAFALKYIIENCPNLKYALLIDADTKIPATFFVERDNFINEKVGGMVYPLRAKSEHQETPQVVKWQDAEYVRSDAHKIFLDEAGVLDCPHGAAAVVRIDELYKTLMYRVNGAFYGEDRQLGEKIGPRWVMSRSYYFSTLVPETFLGESQNLYEQRVRSWSMAPLLFPWILVLQPLLCKRRGSGFAMLISKNSQTYYLYCTLMQILRYPLMALVINKSIKDNNYQFLYGPAASMLTDMELVLAFNYYKLPPYLRSNLLTVMTFPLYKSGLSIMESLAFLRVLLVTGINTAHPRSLSFQIQHRQIVMPYESLSPRPADNRHGDTTVTALEGGLDSVAVPRAVSLDGGDIVEVVLPSGERIGNRPSIGPYGTPGISGLHGSGSPSKEEIARGNVRGSHAVYNTTQAAQRSLASPPVSTLWPSSLQPSGLRPLIAAGRKSPTPTPPPVVEEGACAPSLQELIATSHSIIKDTIESEGTRKKELTLSIIRSITMVNNLNNEQRTPNAELNSKILTCITQAQDYNSKNAPTSQEFLLLILNYWTLVMETYTFLRPHINIAALPASALGLNQARFFVGIVAPSQRVHSSSHSAAISSTGVFKPRVDRVIRMGREGIYETETHISMEKYPSDLKKLIDSFFSILENTLERDGALMTNGQLVIKTICSLNLASKLILSNSKTATEHGQLIINIGIYQQYVKDNLQRLTPKVFQDMIFDYWMLIKQTYAVFMPLINQVLPPPGTVTKPLGFSSS